MVEITSALVRKLRERTDAGIMDCKRALIEENGNIELAIENMRKSGIIRAEKKGGCKTDEGVILIKTAENYGVVLEVNCQTDFATKSAIFREFSEKALKIAVMNKISEVEILRTQLEKDRISLVSKMGENIRINRVAVLESNDILGVYRHGDRIGVLVSIRKTDGNIAKKIAMHIAACRPMFISSNDIPDEILKKEYRIQSDIVAKFGKSKEVSKQIVKGRIEKFIKEISLTEQCFIMNPNKTVAQILEENNAKVDSFVRFEVGEALDKN